MLTASRLVSRSLLATAPHLSATLHKGRLISRPLAPSPPDQLWLVHSRGLQAAGGVKGPASAAMGRRTRASTAAEDNDAQEPTAPAAAKRAKQSRGQGEDKAAMALATEAPSKAAKEHKSEAPADTQAAAGHSQSQEEATAGPAYFLIKSEPHEFSIDDLEQKPSSTGEWDGVRNAQARNIMMSMKLGDQAFYYHSNTKEPGVVGVVKVVREHYVDFTALDKKHKGYDPKSTEEKPKWRMVDVQLMRRTARLIGLKELKQHKDGALQGMQLFTLSRLSVQRVAKEHWEFILGLEHQNEGAHEAHDQ